MPRTQVACVHMPFESLPTRPRPSTRTQRHSTVCADCSTPTVVRFRPRPGRPVYCSPCFKARRSGRAPAAESPPDDAVTACVAGADVFPGMKLTADTRAAIARMNISEPTPIQEKTIPYLLAGRDLIGQARTGSGKTLAFAAPLVEQCDPSVRQVQALVLVPTRELAIQVAGVTEALASSRQLRLTLLYGGRSLGPESTALRNGAQIIVGTPGRTLDHLRRGTLDLCSLRFLVLDEADEMLDRGFAHDVEAILRGTPSGRQTALLSATMPEWVANTATKHLRNPVTVEVDAGMQAVPTVEHRVYSIEKSDKIGALRTLLDQRDGAPIVVFGKTKHGVKKLAKQLDALGYPVGALQGNLSQNARERVMTDFRSGALPILVATNVAARGLDIEGIEQVINYDLPDSEQLFTHRIGRTGRMGRTGEAITFITPEEERKWREIERALGRRFSRKPWRTLRQRAVA
ncbi:MAG: DEAD/DEAH box helicase [Chloroflexi bacterium]|nr:DEAD/DEAH box helicase [Chloroflexota bacterium]MYF65315.1 DEAD/DEAH box helicase [Chloroflexota bacterium]